MRYIKAIIKENLVSVISYLGIGILIAFLSNVKIRMFQFVIDGLSTQTLKMTTLIVYGVILFSVYILNYLDEYPSKKLKHNFYLGFKLLSLKKISQMQYGDYKQLGTGKLTQKIENGASAARDIIYGFWLNVLRDLVPMIAFSVYFIWKINHTITAWILIGYMIVFIITNLLLKLLYRYKEKILKNEEAMNHYLVRGFMEMIVFRLHRQFDQEILKASKAKDQIVHSKVKMNLIHEAFFTIFALIVAALNITILVFAWYESTITVGEVVALLALIENAYTPIAIFNVQYVQYKLDQTAFKQFTGFLDLQEDQQLFRGTSVTSLEGEITVENMSYSYENQPVLESISLEIKAGEHVALVGESGSGKTTFVQLLMGLLKYSSGSIQLDAKELKDLCLNDCYQFIHYVPQNSPVFDGTLRENMSFGHLIEDDLLKRALEKVQLDATCINQLDRELGERGISLSGGERQRVALSRLWLSKQPIVILDEATSALDNVTELKVMDEVLEVTKNQTVIAIAHRLNSIKNFDKIVVFKKGKIIDIGTYSELMDNSPYFRQLHKAGLQHNQNTVNE